MSILKPSFYKQSDSRWAKKHYTTSAASLSAYSSGTSGIAYRAMRALSKASASYNIKAIVIGEIA